MVSVGRINSLARSLYVAAQKFSLVGNTFIQGETPNRAINKVLGFESKEERLQYLADHSRGFLQDSVKKEIAGIPKLLLVPAAEGPGADAKSREFVIDDLHGPGTSVEGRTVFTLDDQGQPVGLSSGTRAQLSRTVTPEPKS